MDSGPRWPICLDVGGFSTLLASQPWGELYVTLEDRYHYAVGVKAGGATG